ncbi:FAD/NAD(P)-binding domain-containing protein [Pisolithus sp. B1]|nr:FAD/NAD(P)-binding domain-containing protein [Pisolithus sp. B1]
MTSKASLKLRILVVGGGITGLAAALKLARAGHNVRVIEKSRTRKQKVCGLRVPPNLTRILDEWGLGEEISRYGSTTTGSECFSMDTGDFLGHFTWQEAVMDEVGAPFLLMHYQDLHNILYQAASSAGVHISLGTPVIQVETHPPRVRLATGEVIRADLIVGADGSDGITREVVEGCKVEDAVDEMSFSVYIAAISREQLKKDPDLDAFTRTECGGPQCPLWMKTSSHAIAFAVRKLGITGDSKLMRLLDLCPTLQRRRYTRKGAPSNWTDSSGRIVLMGEAAHPSFPCITHSASLHVEDAEVFGWLLSRLHNMEQLPHLLGGFEDIREERCRAVHEKERMGMQMMWLPPGPQRDARDHMFRAMMLREGWDEEDLRMQWEEVGQTFGYNAQEAVEDWWVSWGMLRERNLKP